MTEPAQPMNLPRTQTLPPTVEAPTVRNQAPLVVHREGQPTTDLQVLLRKRLRFLAFLAAAGWGVFVLLGLLAPLYSWRDFAIYGFIFAESAVLAGVLWKKSSLSVRQLRVIEVVFFGTGFAYWTL